MAEEEKQIDDLQVAPENAATPAVIKRSRRVQKIGIVASDKMTKTVVVRVDRLVLHRKYRRYVKRTSKFMAHDEVGSTIGDKVRIVETRPLSARKRWRVVEILQKAAK
jgi:small subunit ribosomal protein S17